MQPLQLIKHGCCRNIFKRLLFGVLLSLGLDVGRDGTVLVVAARTLKSRQPPIAVETLQRTAQSFYQSVYDHVIDLQGPLQPCSGDCHPVTGLHAQAAAANAPDIDTSRFAAKRSQASTRNRNHDFGGDALNGNEDYKSVGAANTRHGQPRVAEGGDNDGAAGGLNDGTAGDAVQTHGRRLPQVSFDRLYRGGLFAINGLTFFFDAPSAAGSSTTSASLRLVPGSVLGAGRPRSLWIKKYNYALGRTLRGLGHLSCRLPPSAAVYRTAEESHLSI